MAKSGHVSNGPPHGDVLTFAFEGPIEFDQDKPLYIEAEDPSRALTARQLRVLVSKLIAGFRQSGLQPGERVAVHLPNTCLYTPIFFAIIGAGAVYTASNPAYRTADLEHLFKLSTPSITITCPELLPSLLSVTTSGSAAQLGKVYVLDLVSFDFMTHATSSPTDKQAKDVSVGQNGHSSSHANVHRFEKLLMCGAGDWMRITDGETSKNTPAAIFTTSGTTDLPKLAVLSHNAICTSMTVVMYQVPYKVIRLIALPLFLPFGFMFGHVPAIRNGEPVYILPRLRPDQFVHMIQKYKITDCYMVPAIVYNLLQSGLPLTDMLSSLRMIGVGGGQLNSEAQQAFRKHVHQEARVNYGYGLTETGPITKFKYHEVDHSGSIGRRVQNVDIKLVDQHGNIIPADSKEPGEAFVRGPGMLTYYITAKSPHLDPFDKEGWFPTGDLLYREEDRYYFTGRSKELIKVKGWPVTPTEIEFVLLQHPAIADAAVCGVALEDGVTEGPKAWVVRKPGAADISASEVYDFTKSKLASYKALEGGVVFVQAIPRNAMGKVQRFKLADLKA